MYNDDNGDDHHHPHHHHHHGHNHNVKNNDNKNGNYTNNLKVLKMHLACYYWVASMAIPVGKWVGFVRCYSFFFFPCR